MRFSLLTSLALAASIANSASASTLIHAYEFDGATVTDSAGGANGVLFGDASVSNGALHLDGVGDYVQFNTKLIPLSGAFSLYFSYANTPPASGIAEVISQGSSGAGFYVGEANFNIRLTDSYPWGIPVAFATGTASHDIFLTNDGSATSVYLDGGLVFAGGDIARGAGGDFTRIGRQFGIYEEYFSGDLNAVRVFDGVATYAEASASPSGVPEPAGWATMLAGFTMLGGMLRRRKAALA